jgi:hypothetical protein
MILPVELCGAWSSEEDKEREYHRKKIEKYGPRGTGWPAPLIPDLKLIRIPDKPTDRKGSPFIDAINRNELRFNDSPSDIERTLSDFRQKDSFEHQLHFSD